jgi:hypothetical protein
VLPATSGVACKTDLARNQVDPLIVIQLQVDRASVTEGGDRHPGLCIQRDQAVARRNVEYPLRPVLQATPRRAPTVADSGINPNGIPG